MPAAKPPKTRKVKTSTPMPKIPKTMIAKGRSKRSTRGVRTTRGRG